MPTLLHHYLEHHDENNNDRNDIGFLDFLQKHYNQNNHSDSDKNNHNDLPFKTIDCHSLNTVIALLQQNVFTIHTTFSFSSKNVAFYKEQHYISKSFGNIWQPPKLA